MSWWCDKYNALPEAGGVMDQDYGLIHRMGAAANTYTIITRVQGLYGAAIHSLTEPERRLIASLRKLGVM